MKTISDLLRGLWSALGCIRELLGYLLRFVGVFFQSRACIAARLLAAESQLAVCKRRMEQRERPRPRYRAGFRLLWIVLSKLKSERWSWESRQWNELSSWVWRCC